jgi:hypothetical protein
MLNFFFLVTMPPHENKFAYEQALFVRMRNMAGGIQGGGWGGQWSVDQSGWQGRNGQNVESDFDNSINSASGSAAAPADGELTSNGASSATALDGLVTINGEGADRVAQAVEKLYAESPTFAEQVDAARAKGLTGSIDITDLSSEGEGIAGLGGLGNGEVRLDDGMATASDEQLLSVVSHELGGHAFGGFDDGAEGQAGANQEYNVQVGIELGFLEAGAAARGYGPDLWA